MLYLNYQLNLRKRMSNQFYTYNQLCNDLGVKQTLAKDINLTVSNRSKVFKSVDIDGIVYDFYLPASSLLLPKMRDMATEAFKAEIEKRYEYIMLFFASRGVDSEAANKIALVAATTEFKTGGDKDKEQELLNDASFLEAVEQLSVSSLNELTSELKSANFKSSEAIMEIFIDGLAKLCVKDISLFDLISKADISPGGYEAYSNTMFDIYEKVFEVPEEVAELSNPPIEEPVDVLAQ